MNDDLKVAIIGTGLIAGGYDENKLLDDGGIYTHAGAFSKNPRFSLTSVFDLDYARSQQFKEYWNVGHCAQSIDEIYGSSHDVVSVCTPDETHFEIIRNLLSNRCCRTIYAEKPLADNPGHISEIVDLSLQTGIYVVVNFQRRFDSLYSRLRRRFQDNNHRFLTMNALYMKGLDHSGVAMVDMISSICGYPDKIMAFNRTYNKEIDEYSYDFIFYYDFFNVTVKSIDSEVHGYTYHIFELDMFLPHSRIILNDNSKQCEVRETSNYAYSGVKVLDDINPSRSVTEYKTSIPQATDYIYNIIRNNTPHTINTPQQSYNNSLILSAIKESYKKGGLITIESSAWK